jgi:hypothetical protein
MQVSLYDLAYLFLSIIGAADIGEAFGRDVALRFSRIRR